MCKASNYVNNISKTFKEMKKELNDLSKQISYYDKKVAAIYHEIESTNFDAARGYCLARRLKEILKERRKVKGDFLLIRS